MVTPGAPESSRNLRSNNHFLSERWGIFLSFFSGIFNRFLCKTEIPKSNKIFKCKFRYIGNYRFSAVKKCFDERIVLKFGQIDF